MRARALLSIPILLALTVVAPASAQDTGGAAFSEPPPQPPAPGAAPAGPLPRLTTPGLDAVLGPDGLARAPELAPPAVQGAIWAANEIIGKPYRYGGGHKLRFKDSGYDCSGTVSYALRGGNLLARPLDSSAFMRWGERGPGQWITIYTNPGHAYAVVAGLRLDTSAAGDRSGAKGPRWRPTLRSSRGFRARHPAGL